MLISGEKGNRCKYALSSQKKVGFFFSLISGVTFFLSEFSFNCSNGPNNGLCRCADNRSGPETEPRWIGFQVMSPFTWCVLLFCTPGQMYLWCFHCCLTACSYAFNEQILTVRVWVGDGERRNEKRKKTKQGKKGGRRRRIQTITDIGTTDTQTDTQTV